MYISTTWDYIGWKKDGMNVLTVLVACCEIIIYNAKIYLSLKYGHMPPGHKWTVTLSIYKQKKQKCVNHN